MKEEGGWWHRESPASGKRRGSSGMEWRVDSGDRREAIGSGGLSRGITGHTTTGHRCSRLTGAGESPTRNTFRLSVAVLSVSSHG